MQARASQKNMAGILSELATIVKGETGRAGEDDVTKCRVDQPN
jgi:hypothetical protein